MAIRRSKFMKPDGPTSRLSGDCAIDGCRRPMFRKGLCCAHFKRRQRNEKGKGRPVDGLIGEGRAEGGLELAEVLDPMEKALDASSAWVEVSSEDDAMNKVKRREVIRAWEQVMLSRGWSPPGARARPRARVKRR